MKKILIAALSAALCSTGGAFAATPDVTRTEVTRLLDTVEKSQCQFSRNGTWHDAKAARAHLQKKYDYLDNKKLLTTTESFIERGATGSSMSGAPYQMRCPGTAVVNSADWLKAELARVRK
ncbi:hypothetical protein F2P44_27295 [Massilia sp. CCM 8695]|uniref:DUF5329 domain-containing protein n=1 Tax=Massilia frigida TaxID=2609281 RepID=A0ABX0NCB0_9BURK|nr:MULTISPECIES: DUF5329 domain-containing protein [Massilia]MDM5176371.1 DUF5329 domain-containing protein [Massilia sp. DJPM01]NHZ82953.1 hypothetical protein [Massilia frigida]